MQDRPTNPAWGLWRKVLAWFDASSVPAQMDPAERDRVEWTRIVPFVGMHVACLAVVWVGGSPVAVAVAAALYVVRMFAITGFYHRYFSHRTFKTTRAGSSWSPCSAFRRRSGARSGGRRITGITTSTRTRRRTFTRRRRAVSSGRTSGGSCRAGIPPGP